MEKRKLIAGFMFLAATLMWGLNYAFQQSCSEYLGPFTIVFFKGIGSLLLIPFIIFQKRKIDRRTLIGGIIIGLIAFTGCLVQQLGLEIASVSKASFLTALYIIFVPLVEVFGGKRFSWRLWLAVFLALGGLYLLCFSGTFIPDKADLLLLLGALIFAFQIVTIDHYSYDADPLALTMVLQLTLSFCSAACMFIFERPVISDFKPVLFEIFFMAVFSGVIAQTIQVIYQKDIGATFASLLMSLESVFGVLGGWLILGQVMDLREIGGSILVFLAILLASL